MTCCQHCTARPHFGGEIERGWRDAEGNAWVYVPWEGAVNLGPRPMQPFVPYARVNAKRNVIVDALRKLAGW